MRTSIIVIAVVFLLVVVAVVHVSGVSSKKPDCNLSLYGMELEYRYDEGEAALVVTSSSFRVPHGWMVFTRERYYFSFEKVPPGQIIVYPNKCRIPES